MENQEPEKKIVCSDIKGCRIHQCPAHGKDCDCFIMPNAGYHKSFCKGPMCVKLKRMACPGCPVYKLKNPDSQASGCTDTEILDRLRADGTME